MNDDKPDLKISKFFERMDRLDAGGRARIKRCAGQSLLEARELGQFYSVLPPGVSLAQEETYFLVATLYPLADDNGSGDLGASLRRARQDRNAKGLDRRVKNLLDADESQLAFRLRQAIRFLQSNRVRVDWPRFGGRVRWRINRNDGRISSQNLR